MRRVAVSSSGSLCCPEIFSGAFRFSFRSVFRLKREPPSCSFGIREFPSGAVRAGTGCLAGLPSTAPWEAPSREGLYGRSPSTRQVLSIAFDRFFNLIHKLWITLADAWAGRGRLLNGRAAEIFREILGKSQLLRLGERRPGRGRSGVEGCGVVDEPHPQGFPHEADFRARSEPSQVAELAMGEVAGLIAPKDSERAPLVFEPDGVRTP